MKKIFLGLIFCLLFSSLAYAEGAGPSTGLRTGQTQKEGGGGSSDLSTSDKLSESFRESLSKSIDLTRRKTMSQEDRRQITLAKEKSAALNKSLKRNMAAETLLLTYEAMSKELNPVKDLYLPLLRGASPATYRLTPEVRPGTIDTIYAQMLSQWVSSGTKWGNTNIPVKYGQRLKEDTARAVALGVFLADLLVDISENEGTMQDALNDAKLWLAAHLEVFLRGEYVPQNDLVYQTTMGAVLTTPVADIQFAGGLDKHRVGPCMIDIGSKGLFSVSCAGRDYLSPQAFGGLSADISYTTGISLRESVNDLKGVAYTSDIAKAVAERASEERSRGKSKEAAITERTFRDWAYSLDHGADLGSKLDLLGQMLK